MALPSVFPTRAGFPAGLEVLLVAEQGAECATLMARLGELSYKVTPFSSADEAAAYLASPAGQAIEVLLAEAKAFAPGSEAGCRLRAAAAALPLVLMVDALSPYSAVMHGIELGAVDVLEKPLSSLKLRNIWQHVVRKRMSSADLGAGLALKPEVKAIEVLKGKGASAPTSPRTPSPAASQLTHGSDMTALPAAKGDEASFSGSDGQDGKASSVPEAGESAATADSALGRKAAGAGGKAARAADAAKAAGAQKKLRRSARASEAAAASRQQQQQQQAAARGAATAPLPPTWAQTAPAAGGCVWGTPAMGVGAAPAMYDFVLGSAGGCGAVGSVDTLATHRCGSLVSNTSTLDSGLGRASFDSSFSSFDSAMDLGALDEFDCFPLDECLLPPDDPLFGFDAPLGPACAPALQGSGLGLGAAAPPLPGVCAPIGLKLRKSASLLDMINSQLGAAHCT